MWINRVLQDLEPSDVVTVYFDNDESTSVSFDDAMVRRGCVEGTLTEGAQVGQRAWFGLDQIAYVSVAAM